MAEVKSADEEAAIIPKWYEEYMCGGYKGVRDYGVVIQLLRGNLVEPVTPSTYHVSPQYSAFADYASIILGKIGASKHKE